MEVQPDSRSGESPSPAEDAEVSSTIWYGEEPFDDYSNRIIALFKEVWPDVTEESFKVERMRGGANHRFVRLIVNGEYKMNLKRVVEHVKGIFGYPNKNMGKSIKDDLVIRIPRRKDAWIESDAAMLRFLEAFTTIPSPQLVLSDPANDNALEASYTIHKYVDGLNLALIYDQLNQKQKVSVITELAGVLMELKAHKSCQPGFLQPNYDAKIPPQYQVHLGFPVHKLGEFPEPPTMPSDFADIEDMIVTMCNQWKEVRPGMENEFDELIQVAVEMKQRGVFKGVSYSLYHPDLKMNNILVDPIDDDTLVIKAIIDWDKAYWAPSFMLCTPPVWMWLSEDELPEPDVDLSINEMATAYIPPVDPQQQEIKTAFDNMIDDKFFIYAYHMEYRLARKLCSIAIGGIQNESIHSHVKSLLDEWEEYKGALDGTKPAGQAAGIVYDEDSLYDDEGLYDDQDLYDDEHPYDEEDIREEEDEDEDKDALGGGIAGECTNEEDATEDTFSEYSAEGDTVDNNTSAPEPMEGIGQPTLASVTSERLQMELRTEVIIQITERIFGRRIRDYGDEMDVHMEDTY